METMNDRVRVLRKELGLTLEKFGKRLGVGKTAVYKLETGENNVTDQMVKSICREYNVNYIWLTTGEGDMFKDSDDTFLERIDRIMAGENELHKSIIKAATSLDTEDLLAIERIIEKFNSTKKEG